MTMVVRALHTWFLYSLQVGQQVQVELHRAPLRSDCTQLTPPCLTTAKHRGRTLCLSSFLSDPRRARSLHQQQSTSIKFVAHKI